MDSESPTCARAQVSTTHQCPGTLPWTMKNVALPGLASLDKDTDLVPPIRFQQGLLSHWKDQSFIPVLPKPTSINLTPGFIPVPGPASSDEQAQSLIPVSGHAPSDSDSTRTSYLCLTLPPGTRAQWLIPGIFSTSALRHTYTYHSH